MVVVIQRFARGLLARIELMRRRWAAETIQAAGIAFLVRLDIAEMRWAAIRMQAAYRAFRARQRAAALRAYRERDALQSARGLARAFSWRRDRQHSASQSGSSAVSRLVRKMSFSNEGRRASVTARDTSPSIPAPGPGDMAGDGDVYVPPKGWISKVVRRRRKLTRDEELMRSSKVSGEAFEMFVPVEPGQTARDQVRAKGHALPSRPRASTLGAMPDGSTTPPPNVPPLDLKGRRMAAQAKKAASRELAYGM